MAGRRTGSRALKSLRPTTLLGRLEALREHVDEAAAEAKLELLRTLAGKRMPTAAAVARLHEVLLATRAYAQTEAIRVAAESLLRDFAGRADLLEHASALEDTGIAGTAMHYRFFLTTARWLAKRAPGALTIDWTEFDQEAQLEDMLWMLVPPAEGPALEVFNFDLRGWIDVLKGEDETDAEFVTARLAALDAGPFLREAIYDRLELPMRLAPEAGSPSRTLERCPQAPVVLQRTPLRTGRPDLTAALRRPPESVREIRGSAARELVDLAKGAMVTRNRDLNSFMFADPRDVRLVDCGEGLAFLALGLVPEQRGILEGVYAFITLKNGVPIGYVLSSGLFNHAEVAYNVFPTFRGGEAAWIYGRALSTVHHLLGATVFSVDPYQLGSGNEEGLQSGAWWFYYKLGFRPRDPDVRRLVREEKKRIRANRRHRSSRETLEALSEMPMHLTIKAPRDDAIGRVDGISLAASLYLARRFGADREGGVETCAEEAGASLATPEWRRWRPDEREAWRRWGPILCAMPEIKRWSKRVRRAAAEVVRLKGSRRESDFVLAFDAHPQLRDALLALADRGEAME